MKKSTRITAHRAEKLMSPEDPTLLDFLTSLRLSVNETVSTERSRGIPLAQIVVHVREMVRVREEATNGGVADTSLAFRAISKCAVGWCIDAYMPRGAALYGDRFPLRLPT